MCETKRFTHVKGRRLTHVTSSRQGMPRQTKNSRSRLEDSLQTTPSLLRHREVATSPIRMAEHNKFDDDMNGGEDNVNGKDTDNAAAADVQQIPPLMVPEGINPAVAELL